MKITPDTPISEIVEKYPELADYLIREYGFHCVHCFAADFETLEEGAAVHGVVDHYLDDLLDELNGMLG